MSSGTKILLAVVTLFVGTLVIYYGFVMPSDEESPPADEALVDTSLDASAETRAIERTGEKTPVPVELDEVLAGRAPEREPDPLLVLPTATRRTSVPADPGLTDPGLTDPASTGPATGGASMDGALTDAAPSTAPPTPVPGRTTRPVPVAPKYTPYTVKDGDTMTSIAEWWFDDHRKWDLIAKVNLVDPNRLRVGQVLRLPPRNSMRPPLERGAGAERVVHTVGPGDTLSSIAIAHYGDIAKWERIYQANRAAIGVNPDALKVGMKLTIPAAVERSSAATPGR